MAGPLTSDRVKETTTTTGTGTVNLAGAVTGYRTFVSGIGTGNTCFYVIELVSAGEWEVGIGTVTSGSPDTLSRTTILASSNAGAAVNFSAGAKTTFATAPASRLKLDVTATSRILGRKTAGAGAIEECTLSEVLDFIGSAAHGDILYRGSSSWARLAAGTQNKYLSTNGPGVAPSWVGSLVFLGTASLSSVATSDWVFSWDTSYFHSYLFVLAKVLPATDDVVLQLRTSSDGGSTYDSSAGNYRHEHMRASSAAVAAGGSTSDTEIEMVPAGSAIGNATDEGISGLVWVLNPKAAAHCRIVWDATYADNAGLTRKINGSGARLSAADVDAVRFLMSSGNLASGEIRMYGLPNNG